jgi:DNA-binding transcriptional MerR regulator
MKRRYDISIIEAYELAGHQSKKLARIVGVNPRTIRCWVEGRRTPTPKHYNKLVSGALALYAEEQAKAAGARGGEIYSGQRRDVWRRYLNGRRQMSLDVVKSVIEKLIEEKLAREERDEKLRILEKLQKSIISREPSRGLLQEIMTFPEYLAHILSGILWDFPREIKRKIDEYKRRMHSSDFYILVKYEEHDGKYSVKEVQCAKTEEELENE